jgi:RHS repeat-associated protein
MKLSCTPDPSGAIFKRPFKCPFQFSWLPLLPLQSKAFLFGLIGIALAQVATGTDVATYFYGASGNNVADADYWALNWTITSDNAAVPGDYTFATLMNGVEAANCGFTVTVFADHTVSPTFVQPYPLAGLRGYQYTDQTIVFTAQLTAAPPNYNAAGQHAGAGVGSGAAVLFGSRVYNYCGSGGPCSVQNVGVAGTVSIGSAPVLSPTPGANVTVNDKKSGGNENGPCPGMARYSIHSMLVSLNIVDTPLRYSPPYGPPVDFTVTYNQKETQQPSTFTYSNLGPKWTFNWLAYVSDDPNSQLPLTGVYVPGGGAEMFAFDPTTQTFGSDPQSHANLVKTGATSYERRMSDGSKQIFGLSDGAASYPRRVFMTQVVDPAGNAVSIGYDGSFRVTSLTDALGQTTNVAYELPADPLKITKVTDPFGRYATFQYSAGQLATITDEIGIQSTANYLTGTDSVNSLATPYGTTTFTSGQNGTNRWIEATDPLGGKERVEYRNQAPGISASDPVAPSAAGITNAGLDMANTFFWDKKAMLVAPGDYTKAQITHWLYNTDASVSGIASSEKQPLESRVWYTYAGQSDYQHAGSTANPSQVARVLADGSTQLSQFEYNGLGRTTKATDQVGRVITYIYDTNNIDMLEIRQTRGANNELLRKFTFNTQHEPLTNTDASGQPTTYTYNTQGQILTSKNAKNETTTYAYGGIVPAGYLASITSPAFNSTFAVTTFTYDSLKRVRTVTDTDNYTITTDYDNLDRKLKVTYPDTTYEQSQYTDNNTGAMTLDLTASRDRRGLWTYRHYDANQHMDSIKDPANQTTLYSWCTCGALASITDPKNQITTFNRDIQSRVYQKVFQDTTAINYLYEGQTAPNTVGATSRLQSLTDAKSQRTNYVYFADNTVQQISYTNTTGGTLTPPTPTVSYIYDSNYNRVSTMTDGTGTTTYGYYPITVPAALGAGQLASIDGPLANDNITLGYDELGRTTSRSINGAANASAMGFDSLGRPNGETDNLGAFGYSYVGVTNRLQAVNYPNGQTSGYAYFPNSGDKQLQTLQNFNANMSNLSKFDYVYDKEHMITQWTKQSDAAAAQPLYLTYDGADQLVDWKNNTILGHFGGYDHSLSYDLAGNRQTDIYNVYPGGWGDPTQTRKDESFNPVNELLAVTGADPTPPPGPGPLEQGEESDPPPPPPADTYTYDPNGNMTARIFWRGGGNTFEWDAANRLIAINYTGNDNRTEFVYDGLSHRKKIVEKTGATITSTKQFVWIGNRIGEERDTSNVVTRRYFGLGEQRIGGTDAGVYYYAKDHLGSIREMTDGAGSLRARYDYDPFGNTTKVSGDLTVDFGYTGHYRHAGSNLYLAPYRAYDPTIGRWISRDPLQNAEMNQGPNIYVYVRNEPLNAADLLGLYELDQAAAQQIGGYIADTQRAIQTIQYLHRHSDEIGYVDYQTAIRAAGFGDAGIAGIGAVDSASRAHAITEAINEVEDSPTLTATRIGTVGAGILSAGLYQLLTLGAVDPHSGMYYYTLGELNAENQLLDRLFDIQSALREAGLLPGSQCP